MKKPRNFNKLQTLLDLLNEKKITPTPEIICFLVITDKMGLVEKEKFFETLIPFMSEEKIGSTFELLRPFYIVTKLEGVEYLLFRPLIEEDLALGGLKLKGGESVIEIRILLQRAAENALRELLIKDFFNQNRDFFN